LISMFKDRVEEFYKTDLKENELLVLYAKCSAALIRLRDKVILFDPSNYFDEAIDQLESLNFLFYTHDHYDHFNLDSTLKIYNRTTCIIFAEPKVHGALEEYLPGRSLVRAKAGLKARVEDITMSFIEGKHVGPIVLYYLKIGDVSIFHGGDSAYVPLEAFKNTTLALLPTGYPSPTASPKDALKMATDLNPRYIIAFHGSDSDHEEFKRLVEENLPEAKLFIPRPGDIIKVKL